MQIWSAKYLCLFIVIYQSGLFVYSSINGCSISLKNKVVCITGASRRIGRGIGLALAQYGATVYVTGRSLHSSNITDPLIGSLTQTVEDFNRNGGKGIAVQIDHRNDEEVKQLFQRIEKESGRLDILINNAFQLPSIEEGSFKKFWEQPPSVIWDNVMNVGCRSHFASSHYAFHLLNYTANHIPNSSTTSHKPIIINISSFGGVTYSFNIPYGVGKTAVDRMTKDLHKELQPLHIHCHPSIPAWYVPNECNRFWILMNGEDFHNSEHPQNSSNPLFFRVWLSLNSTTTQTI